MATTKSANAAPEPIFFTFPESVFGRRLQRYLNLRSLPYTPLRVPPNMPRPVLQESLGINHRRIPIFSLGRDIYCDTRLILQKLETLFPDSPDHPTLGAKDSFGKGFEEMLEGWVIDAGPFWRTSGCLPPQAPLLRDEVWMKDRSEGSGGAFTHEALRSGQTWCISQLRVFFGIMENILGDGREWVLGGAKPGLADIHAGWVYDWAINMATDMFVAANEREEATGSMSRVLNEKEFPMVHDWVSRFRTVCDEASKANKGAKVCGTGEEAEKDVVKRILSGGFAEPEELVVEDDDILGLKRGARVSVAPADFGFTHADTGVLVGLTRNEVVVEIQHKTGGSLRLHYPRIDFKITPVDEVN